MSSLAAASLVIGILVLIGGPALYWIFFKMDAGPRIEPVSQGAFKPLKKEEIEKIESLLEVTLPKSYVDFLMSDEKHSVDDTTVLTGYHTIIDATLEYRKGFENLTPWPNPLIYLGDEADASPYVLDTSNGSVKRYPKGEITKEPFESYESFEDLLFAKNEN